ncbi:MAG: hypothetical protein U0T81_04690 [Saprospiraceae bacterium]
MVIDYKEAMIFGLLAYLRTWKMNILSSVTGLGIMTTVPETFIKWRAKQTQNTGSYVNRQLSLTRFYR